MKTAQEILNELGIEASNSREGTQNTRCPKCSDTRKKKRARCLKVKIDIDGVRWYCHHCSDNGGIYYSAQENYSNKPVKRKTLGVSDMRRLRT